MDVDEIAPPNIVDQERVLRDDNKENKDEEAVEQVVNEALIRSASNPLSPPSAYLPVQSKLDKRNFAAPIFVVILALLGILYYFTNRPRASDWGQATPSPVPKK